MNHHPIEFILVLRGFFLILAAFILTFLCFLVHYVLLAVFGQIDLLAEFAVIIEFHLGVDLKVIFKSFQCDD